MGKGKEERRGAKGKEFIYLAILIIFVLILTLKPSDRKEERNVENSNKNLNSLKIQNSSNEPIIKFELLKKRNINSKEGRNIFQPIRPKVEPQPQIPEVKEELEEEFIVPFKLVCIIETPDSENSRMAVLSKDEDIIFAKKGDVLEGEFEILYVEEEGVIFKSLKNGKEKRIEFEEK